MSFFDDDFYNTTDNIDDFSRNIFNSFEQHTRMMNQFLSNAFGGNHSIEDQSEGRRQGSGRSSEGNQSRSSGQTNQGRSSNQARSSNQPRVQEPDDEQHQPQGYFYSSTTTTYSDGSGVFHARRKVQDNAHGTRFTETRRIGDKSVTWNRDVDKEGRTYDTETRHNIQDNEVGSFAAEWERRRPQQQQQIGYSPSSNTGQRPKGKQLSLK
jgi:hypothetical protein